MTRGRSFWRRRGLMPCARRWLLVVLAAPLLGIAFGCATNPPHGSYSVRPPRSEEVESLGYFVGSWDWFVEGQLDGAAAQWSGSAEWDWTLDRRCLQGRIAGRSGNLSVEMAGVWTWHPTERRYMWWLFNDWGFPQEGTAALDAASRRWTFDYVGVGTDGQSTFGRYTVVAEDANTFSWRMDEWADALRLSRRAELAGTFHRQR